MLPLKSAFQKRQNDLSVHCGVGQIYSRINWRKGSCGREHLNGSNAGKDRVVRNLQV